MALKIWEELLYALEADQVSSELLMPIWPFKLVALLCLVAVRDPAIHVRGHPAGVEDNTDDRTEGRIFPALMTLREEERIPLWIP